MYGKERADGSRRKGLLEKYKEKGYLVRDISKGYTERHLSLEMQEEFKGKDYNELLVYKCSKNQELELIQNKTIQEGHRR